MSAMEMATALVVIVSMEMSMAIVIMLVLQMPTAAAILVENGCYINDNGCCCNGYYRNVKSYCDKW